MQQPFNMDSEEFRTLGHQLIDKLADHYASLRSTPMYQPPSHKEFLDDIGLSHLPENGEDARDIVERSLKLLSEHTIFTAHPRFWGYVTGPGAPIGTLGDLLVSAFNPVLVLWRMAPAAIEIELQTVAWIADFIGFPSDCGGTMTSGGTMSNITAIHAARVQKVPWSMRQQGLHTGPPLRIYCSKETHTWILKCADLCGLGFDSIRWISTDANLRIDTDELEAAIIADRERNELPFCVVATAGTVGTGQVDDLDAIADICQRHQLWFHIDGAYGAPAAALPSCKKLFAGIEKADSIAVDAHKWLFCAVEAGCVLVRDRRHLADAFRFTHSYFHAKDPLEGQDLYELGVQTTRMCRAMRMWMMFQQAGRSGLQKMIQQNIDLAQLLSSLLSDERDFSVVSCSLSIVTFQYVPCGLMAREQVNSINEALVPMIQNSGTLFLSNAIVGDKYCLRACITNYNSQSSDVYMVPKVIRELHATLKKPYGPCRSV